MSQKKRSTGHLRELRARGVTFDRSGRARAGGKFVSDRSLSARLGAIGRSATGVKLATLLARRYAVKTIPSAKEIARDAGVTERTARDWIAGRKRVPDAHLDRVASRIVKAQAYDTSWKHGRLSKPTSGEAKRLEQAFIRFVRAKTRNDPKMNDFYDKWRRMKDFVRGRLTEKAWKQLLRRIGKREGLQEYGMFSVMRFILS